MRAVWDLVIRGLAVLGAWWRLRHRPSLRRLASIGNPETFGRAMLVPAGGHLGLAVCFLPRPLANEAGIAFLTARALDGFEDLSPDRAAAAQGVRDAVAFVCFEGHRPPRTGALVAHRPSDQVEQLLASRLPLLRAAIEYLPDDARARTRDVVRRIGAGMVAGLDEADRDRYAVQVLGEAVRHAIALCAPDSRVSRAACDAAARVLQAANDLRDLGFDRAHPGANRARAGGDPAHPGANRSRSELLLRVLPDLPLLPNLLRSLAAAPGGVRACVVVLATTTCAFYLRQLGRPVPRALRPLRAALGAARDPRRYHRTVDAIERAWLDAIVPARPGALPRPLAAQEQALAAAHPDRALGDALGAAASLIGLSMELIHTLPEPPLDTTRPEVNDAILVADCLLFHAIDRLSVLGPASIEDVGALMQRLAAHPSLDALAAAGDVAAFTRDRVEAVP